MQAPADQHHRCSDTGDEKHLQNFGRALSIAGEVGAQGLQRVVRNDRIGRQQKANNLEEVGFHTLVAWCVSLKAQQCCCCEQLSPRDGDVFRVMLAISLGWLGSGRLG